MLRCVALAACLLAAAGPTASAASEPAGTAADRLAQVHSFAFALGVHLSSRNVRLLAARDLVVVDGEDASAATVGRLQARGAIVLGYLSVGSVESWRPWYPQLRDHQLGPLGSWQGERVTDVRDAAARDVLADSVAPQLLAKGFDGLFLDNVDVIEDHAALADSMVDLVGRIAARVHAGGGALMLQNADGAIDRFLPVMDAWNREDATGTYDADRRRYVLTGDGARREARATLRRVRVAGKLTTTTDYFASTAAPAARRAVRLACSVGAVPTIADISLHEVLRRPARCPSDPGRR